MPCFDAQSYFEKHGHGPYETSEDVKRRAEEFEKRRKDAIEKYNLSLKEWEEENLKNTEQRLHMATRLLCDVLTYLNHEDVDITTKGYQPKYKDEILKWWDLHKLNDELLWKK